MIIDNKMKKLIYTAIFLFFVFILSCCSGGQNRQYSYNGWTIDVDLNNEKISLINKNLGTVLDTIRLQTLREGVDYQAIQTGN